MFALATESTDRFGTLLNAVPERLRKYIKELDTDRLLELRLRLGGLLFAVYTHGGYIVSPTGGLSKNSENALTVTDRDIKRAVELVTDFSMYAYENEMKNGFITIPGGHRIGICGSAAISQNKISHLKSIQSLNYRFAREVKGCSDPIMDKVIEKGDIKNTVIVSPPMCGKTTILRDIARNLSLLGKRVSIIDERGEIAGITGDSSPFDLGFGCDVLTGVSKNEGMLFMLRSMSPDVIITDEIGTKEDFEAIREIKKRGVAVIASLHGRDIKSTDFDNVVYLKGIGAYA